jgi:hypothetical protein
VVKLLNAIRSRPVLVGFVAVAFVSRVLISLRFHGWEEDDYGNLARSFAVASGGLGELTVSHLPLYYVVNAALIRVFGHAEIVCVATSLVCGVAALGLAMDLARRMAGPRAEILVGTVLMVQGEFALYSSTSLREPMYSMLALLGLWWLVRGHVTRSGAAMAATMLVRADAMVTFWPAWMLLSLPRKRDAIGPFLGGLACLAAVVIGWSLWSRPETGSWLFFAPQLYANLTFGGLDEQVTLAAFLRHGAEVCTGLLTVVLPKKFGWPLLVAALWTVLLVARRRLWDHGVVATTLFLALTLGFWLGCGFVFQHGIEHNLYWKWLYASVPLLTLVAVVGLLDIVERLDARWGTTPGRLLVTVTLAWFAVCAALDIRYQVNRADEWYLPQVELAQWIEAEVPPGTAIILDNVPRSYINRRDHGYKLLSWFDLEEVNPNGDVQGFDGILDLQEVRYVLWFRETWTRAATVAPFLGNDEPVILPRHELVPLRHDDAYGWAFYEVNPL